MSIANTQAKTIFEAGIIESNDQTEARVEHLKQLESLVGNSYPNKFDRSRVSGKEDTISNILAFAPIAEVTGEIKAHILTLSEGERPAPELKESLNAKLKNLGNVRVSGRLAVPPRVMGKAAFVHLSDGVNRLQIYVRKQDASVISNETGKVIEDETAAWEVFKFLDHGDFIGAEGYLFLTNTGELSVHVETFQFLSKALLPMPDKMHGIADAELKRRFRYADLIASSLQVEHEGLTTREVFERRAKLISGMRRFLDDAGYTEVETPMLTPKATGAAATPFATHHNALDIPLYARIAPELYLKRLTVGGFEKVYELNRNFRNEGLSHKHNPEFTMLEFYCAYMDVAGMMDFAEAMLKESVQKATGSLQVTIYDKNSEFKNNKPKIINFEKNFERLSMREAIAKDLREVMPKYLSTEFEDSLLDDSTFLLKVRFFLRFENEELLNHALKQMTKADYHLTDKNQFERIKANWAKAEEESIKDNEFNNSLKADKDKLIVYIFEEAIESTLGFVEHSDRIDVTPSFIIDYPKSISPLSKASPENPQIAERFELFINGMEVANGFSELNDPQEQYERFIDQMKERETGDHEAMVMDEDYIRALAYGMPPAAGIGIGIDRLVMLLTNKHSIRDVILFPHMRPERKESEKDENQADDQK